MDSFLPCTFQIDSPAQLANVLVNVTNNTMEIQSEDVSLTVGLLDTVTNSTEDLQQSDVSIHTVAVQSFANITITSTNDATGCIHYFAGSNGCPFDCE